MPWSYGSTLRIASRVLARVCCLLSTRVLPHRSETGIPGCYFLPERRGQVEGGSVHVRKVFRKPHVLCEHVDTGQQFGIDIVLVFCCQVLCVTKQGHRGNIYLRGV